MVPQEFEGPGKLSQETSQDDFVQTARPRVRIVLGCCARRRYVLECLDAPPFLDVTGEVPTRAIFHD